MKRKKRTETTIEAHQLYIIRKPGGSVVAWCPGCGAQASMVAPETVAILSGVNVLTVFRWVEAGLVHFTETSAGSLLVCLNSLPAAASVEKLVSQDWTVMNSEGGTT